MIFVRKQSKSKSSDSTKDGTIQTSLFDLADDIIVGAISGFSDNLDKEDKQEIIQSAQNRIEDVVQKNQKEEESYNLRSEQIIISKENYPNHNIPYRIDQSVDSFSKCCHYSKNLYNQCLYEIRHAYFGKLSLNIKNKMEEKLRFDIMKDLDRYKNLRFEELKEKNYKNSVYKLLDKYFKDQGKIDRRNGHSERDNYSWSPQAAQQIIDMTVEARLDNDLARRDWNENPDHRTNYTGEPGLVNYIKKKSEYISVFTNQQCNIETKQILIPESINEQRMRYETKSVLTFPDHLNILPIELGRNRLSNKSDLREVRIIPLIKRGFYKIELVTKKVIDKIRIRKDKFVNIKDIGLDPNRIIGIDTGQENVVTIADNIGGIPIIIKGGVLLSINQWFDKIGSRLYEVYYRQQRHKGSESKGKTILICSKMQNLSQNRLNEVLDILYKISRFITNHCIYNKIGTIVWGRNPGWKQKINIGKRNNQKFTKIPHYLLFKMLKYKSSEIGINVIDHEEAHTSKCSFPDLEVVGHHNKYMGKRTKRGLFRSLKGLVINADVNAAYNIIRKVIPDAFSKFIRNGVLMIKTIGIVSPLKDCGEGVVLHPLRLSVSDLSSTCYEDLIRDNAGKIQVTS